MEGDRSGDRSQSGVQDAGRPHTLLRQKVEMEAEVPQDSLISLCQFLAEKFKNI